MTTLTDLIAAYAACMHIEIWCSRGNVALVSAVDDHGKHWILHVGAQSHIYRDEAAAVRRFVELAPLPAAQGA